MKISKYSGKLLIGTGVIHNVFGVLVGWETLKSIYTSGLVNSINNEMDKNAIFWFLFTGFMMMILGQFMNQYIKETNSLPKHLGIYILALSITGCIIMPLSGLWLLIPQALIIIVANKNKYKGSGTSIANRNSVA